MARVDFNSLDYDTKIGRKAIQCGKCKKVMAVTTPCPMRERSQNKYVCWHCCHKCGNAVDTPQGKACSIKISRRKRELEEQQAVRAAKNAKRGKGNDRSDNGIYTFLPENGF